MKDGAIVCEHEAKWINGFQLPIFCPMSSKTRHSSVEAHGVSNKESIKFGDGD